MRPPGPMNPRCKKGCQGKSILALDLGPMCVKGIRKDRGYKTQGQGRSEDENNIPKPKKSKGFPAATKAQKDKEQIFHQGLQKEESGS